MSEPTCQALCCRGVGCLSDVGTHLPGPVGQGCRLFKWCQNLHAGHCIAGVQGVAVVSEPTCRALCCRGAGCLRGVRTYLPGTVLQGYGMFKRCHNLSSSTVLQGCRMFKRCPNLPGGHCVTG